MEHEQGNQTQPDVRAMIVADQETDGCYYRKIETRSPARAIRERPQSLNGDRIDDELWIVVESEPQHDLKYRNADAEKRRAGRSGRQPTGDRHAERQRDTGQQDFAPRALAHEPVRGPGQVVRQRGTVIDEVERREFPEQ